MAKKSANSDFNMSEAIRDILGSDPKLGSKEVAEAIMQKYPSAKINKNSFSVAFYTCRKKMGLGGGRRGRKFGKRVGRPAAGSSTKLDMAVLQTTARFLSQVGGAEAAIEAIKHVQAIQVK